MFFSLKFERKKWCNMLQAKLFITLFYHGWRNHRVIFRPLAGTSFSQVEFQHCCFFFFLYAKVCFYFILLNRSSFLFFC
jgi:hypothetical protein